MALLKEIQAKVPSAESVVGRVIAYHEGKHYDLGEYAGDGVVKLSPAGEGLLATVAAAEAAVEEDASASAAKARAKKSGLLPAMNADLGA